MTSEPTLKPLAGWRVLVPRGGPWGDGVAAELRQRGGTPVIAPMINFAPTDDPAALTDALHALEAGEYDWLTMTSATTVDVIYSQNVTIPEHTKVGAVGETTAAALQAMGYRVDLVPSGENSAMGLLAALTAREPEPRRILTLRSELAKPLLTQGLTAAGHNVNSVIAYRTVGEPVSERIRQDVVDGKTNAILITSGSVAEQVAAQFGPLPDTTLVAAIGPQTKRDAEDAGLPVHVVSSEQTITALLDAIADAAQSGMPEPQPLRD